MPHVALVAPLSLRMFFDQSARPVFASRQRSSPVPPSA
jgi:hypothetical protein